MLTSPEKTQIARPGDADRTAPAVVMLHGSACTGAQWGKLKTDIEACYATLAVDLPGYGGSPAVVARTGSALDAQADAVFEQMSACGEPVHLVAHSYGATIAIRIAIRWPDHVRSLTLIEPALFHILRHGDKRDRRLFSEISSVAGTLAAGVVCDAPEGGMARFVDFWNGPGCWDAIGADMRRSLTAMAGQVMADFRTILAERWSIAALAGIRCPSLILKGTRSPAVATRIADHLGETIPGATLISVLDAGHMMPLTHPDRINPLIAEHIRQADAARRQAENLQEPTPADSIDDAA